MSKIDKIASYVVVTYGVTAIVRGVVRYQNYRLKRACESAFIATLAKYPPSLSYVDPSVFHS